MRCRRPLQGQKRAFPIRFGEVGPVLLFDEKTLLGQPPHDACVLDGNILSLDPAKLAYLLPERLQADRVTGSSAWIQVTYAGDFSCLLRVGRRARSKEQRE
jgi:hypothetical protein